MAGVFPGKVDTGFPKGQIVVAAGIEARDAVVDAAEIGEEEDRGRMAPLAQAPDQATARQHQGITR